MDYRLRNIYHGDHFVRMVAKREIFSFNFIQWTVALFQVIDFYLRRAYPRSKSNIVSRAT